MKRIFSVMSAVALSAALLTGCGKKKQAEVVGEEVADPFVIGFIYIGPIGDGGWTYAHDQGRLMVEERMGPAVKTIYKESVPEGPEVKDVMRGMIDQGAKLIIATSFGYMDYELEVAKEFPEVTFLHCSGYKSSENMGNYFGRIYQPRYLSGIVAGLKTKTGKIGYVAAFEIPEVVRGINAFTLGVRSVNPDAEVHVRWTHTWYDPAKEKDAAIALLDAGADVITQHQDTAGPQQAAQERGVWSIGYNSDMAAKAPKAHMTAPVWNWGPYYAAQAEAVVRGSWKSESYWGGLKEGIVQLAPLTDNAPAGAAAKVKEVEQQLIDGTFKVFSGPIKDQSGAVRVPAGTSLSDQEMLSMAWFVEGVVGKIAKKD